MQPEIIDIHPHIISDDPARYPPAPVRGKQSVWSSERPQTFEQLIDEMDRAGVAKAAIVQASTYYGPDNSYIADAVARCPKRFVGVCSIDVVADNAVEVLEGWLSRGFGGLRIFTGGATHGADNSVLADPRTFPVWEFAQSAGFPICVQTTPEGLSIVAGLLEKFPGVKVILDHLGRPMLEDGPPYHAAEPLFSLARYPNLYLKITPRTFALAEKGASTCHDFFPRLVEEFGSDRIAYGSNLPANEGPLENLVQQAIDGLAALDEKDRNQILSGTAKALYPALA